LSAIPFGGLVILGTSNYRAQLELFFSVLEDKPEISSYLS